jgi:sulfur carrier protein ThiS
VIRIYNIQKKEELLVEGPKDVLRILKELAILEDTVLVIRNGSLLTKDTVVEDGARIEILPVVSGG